MNAAFLPSWSLKSHRGSHEKTEERTVTKGNRLQIVIMDTEEANGRPSREFRRRAEGGGQAKSDKASDLSLGAREQRTAGIREQVKFTQPNDRRNRARRSPCISFPSSCNPVTLTDSQRKCREVWKVIPAVTSRVRDRKIPAGFSQNAPLFFSLASTISNVNAHMLISELGIMARKHRQQPESVHFRIAFSSFARYRSFLSFPLYEFDSDRRESNACYSKISLNSVPGLLLYYLQSQKKFIRKS
ncbi:hypothetical protein H920_02712 [Fukomys damarensis]|uniref:Uncharacterized protein n=1 Tax=Fukomys damarensis TaxID=885580 RepID=A0A091DZY0_FUKDA|nr:hypothetical protein H920_02712 [Fukomys damarensis]